MAEAHIMDLYGPRDTGAKAQIMIWAKAHDPNTRTQAGGNKQNQKFYDYPSGTPTIVGLPYS